MTGARGGIASLLVALVVASASCTSDDLSLLDGSTGTLPESSHARERLEGFHARGLVARFELAPADGQTHVLAVPSAEASRGVARTATVLLPRSAAGAVRVEDVASHMKVSFSLDGALDAPLEVAGGLALYANAYRGLADVVHRVTAEGTEDFVRFRSRPASAQLAYTIDVSQAVGLRLVANSLELLDATGAPQLRVAPPYVLDAKGVRHDAALSLTGCQADDNAAAPWGRAVTAPGATVCKMHVNWPDDIAYPAVVDPSWTSTGSMTVARFGHVQSLLPSGKVLVAGGYGGAYLSSADLYNPATGTFAATGSMQATRTGHSANLLASGKVLVSGGRDIAGPLANAELYDPAFGTFSATGAMGRPHEVHTASTLASGKVLVAGGLEGGSVHDGAEVYDPATNAFTTVGSMTSAREHHTATVLASGKVLVVGGTTGAFGFATAELFDPVLQTFAATGSLTGGRFFHAATALPSGKVLVTGGVNQPNYLSSSELYDPVTATFSATGSMVSERQGHTSTLLLPSGKVLIGTGSNSNGTLGDAELYDPVTGTFAGAGALSIPRGGQSATRLASGKVLFAGGGNGSATSSAELFLVLAGGSCAAATDCASSVCQDGTCCGGACSGACLTCTVGTGACVAVTGAEDPDSCSGASACDAAGACKLKTAQPCPAGGGTCLSGFCADGFCCNAACDGSCDSCALSGKQGTCSPLPLGDLGASPACSAGVCDGVHETCATTCSSDLACAPSFYCAASGTCQQRKAQGQACNQTDDCNGGSCRVCTSGSCVDGVCCDSACDAPCSACSAALKTTGADGSCGLAKEGSAPIRGTCPKEPAPSCGADGKCSGAGGCRLHAPGGTSCGPAASCTREVATSATACDGTGTCAPGQAVKCGAYACGATACNTTCTSDVDCAAGGSCDVGSHKCVSGATCDGDHTTTDPSGAKNDCVPYKCENNGTCKLSCHSVVDCVAPTLCDPSGKCVAPEPDDTSGCSAAPGRRRSSSSIAFSVLALMFGLVHRKRRRSAVSPNDAGATS